MPRFSINVSMMLNEVPFLDRFAAAAELGFKAVDIQLPYDFPAAEVAARVRAAGVEVVLINVPMAEGDSRVGYASDPAQKAKFRDAVAKAREYTVAIGNTRINVLATRPPEGIARERAVATFTENLAFAATAFAEDRVQAMVEFINGRDVPGFLVQTPEQALEAIDAAGHPNLALQFDLYHRQVMQGNVIEGVRAHLPRIAHIQFADNPGRHEPGTGELNYGPIFAAIDAMGYTGWVGAEYRPTKATGETLAWMR